MTKVLITGATGTVGIEVLSALQKIDHGLRLFVGVRNKDSGDGKLTDFKVERTEFDFTDDSTFLPALKQVDVLFLLRPPQITNVKDCFVPLVHAAKISLVKHIVFLSVQGVEKSNIIPHHKIEVLIVGSKIPYTFLRPAYFMQNFTKELNYELVNGKRIYLPAGKAEFTLIDVEDIGAVAAKIMTEPQEHTNKSYELTNGEALTFQEMADKLNIGLNREIEYVSPNLLQFFWTKLKQGVSVNLILVMITLHYLPRFQKSPRITTWVEDITGQRPKSFDDFIKDKIVDLR